MINVLPEIITKLKNAISDATIIQDYAYLTKNKFPIITIRELSNVTDITTIDSSGVYANNISFEVNVFTKGNNKEQTAFELRDKVDDIMVNFYKMSRSTSEQVDNYVDSNIYRWLLRYDCKIDNNLKIYRG